MLEEIRKLIFDRDIWRCNNCGMPATEIAHRVAFTESNKKYCMKRYGITHKDAEGILNHPSNLAASCRECNDYFNIGYKRHIAEKMMNEIAERMGLASSIKK
jgi:hypothetical protein